jgi:PAS domain S-box-containing protein
MYRHELPADSGALRQLAEDRVSATASQAIDVRDLQIRNAELELRVAELERTNLLLSAAVENSPSALFVKDHEGRYLLMNPAAVQVTGKTLDEVLGKDDRDIFDAEAAEVVRTQDQAIMHASGSIREVHQMSVGGVERIFWTKKAPFRDATGQVMGVVGAARDATEVEEARLKLSESEERFRTLAENLPDGLYVLDPTDEQVPLKILYANRAAAASDGFTVEEIIGKSMVQSLDTHDSGESASERRARIERGEVLEFEVEHRHRDGHIVPYDVRAVSIPWQGKTAILGINRNITSRRRNEARLRKSHAFQDALIRSAGQGICVCHLVAGIPHPQFTIWNDQMVELTGYTREEINDQGCTSTLYPATELRERAEALLSEIWTGADVRAREMVITRKDGERREILISASQIATGDQEPAVVATFVDITQRKESERQLQASEARYRTFVDHVTDAMFLHDDTGKILDVNRQACESLGLPREELIGAYPFLFDPDTTQEQLTEMTNLLDSGEILRFDTRHRRKDGTLFPVEIRVRPFTENGQRMALSLVTDITRRKEIERELRDSNERFSLVMRATMDAIWDWKPGTQDIWWNVGMFELFGYADNEGRLDPAWWLHHIHPDDRSRVEARFYSHLRGSDTMWSDEYRFRRKDGVYVDVFDRGQIVRDEQGVPTRMFGAMMDISERKRAEAGLRASEQRFRELADAIPQIVWTARPDGGLDHLNARAVDYTGIDVEGLKDWSWDKAIHPDDLPEVVQDWSEILRTGVPKPLVFRIRRADGEYRWHMTRQVASRDADGVVQHWYGTCTDIEDYKRVETALRESQRRFEEFMKHLPGLAWIKDLDGRYEFGNEMAARVFRVDTADLVGKTDEQLFDAETAAEFRRNDQMALERRGAIQCVETLEHVDGSIHHSLVSKFIIPGPDQQPAYIGGVAIDITAHRKVEEALRTSEERYRTLFHSIPDPMFVYDPATLQYLAVNDAAVKKYGYSRTEFLRMKITDLRPPDEVPSLLKMLADSRPMFENRGQWRHQTKQGKIIHVEVTAHSLQLDGKPVAIVLAHDVSSRIEAEAEVRRTTELLRVVAEETPDAVFVKNREGKYLLFNPAAARFVGRSVEEVIGHDDTALFSREDAESVMQSDRRVMQNGRAETNEEVLTAAGVTRTYLAMKAPYRDGNGNITGTIGISRDITERKQAELLVKESQQRLQAFFNNALNAILLASDDGTFVDANPAACAMLGYSRQELLRMKMAQILALTPDGTTPNQKFAQQWEEFLGAGNQRGSVHLRRRDAAVIIAEYSAVANVLPGLHLSVLSDVTERIQAEEAFRKVSAIHERIIHTAVEGICLCQPNADRTDVVFSVWNDRMTAITGYTREEINELGWFHTLFGDSLTMEQAHERLMKLLQRMVVQGEEWEIDRKDGERRVISVSTSFVESDDRTPLFVALIQDVTDRRHNAEELAMRQAELRHVSRLNSVGQMVAALSHEVAQPLAAISNFAASTAALLKTNQVSAGESIRDHIEQITQQSRRAAEIIRRLRDFSRKSSQERRSCDVNDLLWESVEMLSHELRRGEVQILWNLTPWIPTIQADAIQLQQVFVNLLLNARDALLESPADDRRIHLRSRRVEDDVVIDVEDNGVGISEEISGRLFEPFATTKPQGMGIGLSICRSILREHGGDITYHKVTSGGTCFRIRMAISNPTGEGRLKP